MIALFLVPLVAAIIGIVMIVSAAKEYTSDDMNTREIDNNTIKSRIIICGATIISSAIYGLFSFMFTILKEINKMSPYLWLCVALLALGALLSGFLMAKNIKGGEFFTQNGFGKTTLYGCAGTFVSIIGLLLFMLKIMRM